MLPSHTPVNDAEHLTLQLKALDESSRCSVYRLLCGIHLIKITETTLIDMKTLHSFLHKTSACDSLRFATWTSSDLSLMYNVNIKWGNSTHFLSLLLHTLVTQRKQSYTIHFSRESQKRGSFPLWEWKRQTQSDRSAVGRLENVDKAAKVARCCWSRLDSLIHPKINVRV